MILYYITDRKQFPGEPADQRQLLLRTIRHCAEAGVDMVQLREKDLSGRELETLGREVVKAIAGSATTLLVNGRIDVAIAVGAHGVHFPSGAGQLPASEARAVFEKAGIHQSVIGVSCHSNTEVAYAEAHGANFAIFGPVYQKAGDPNPLGLSALTQICSRPGGPNSSMPVLAIGGVTADNAEPALSAGASGIAGIRLFQEAPDLPGLMQRLRGLAAQKPAIPLRHPYQF
jgi:thiamine-phosphate pyrophosphorylase